MSQQIKPTHGQWSRLVFVLAATGSAIGLGNIWKFPYITGEHGGGAFVLVYLVCILAVGIPIMIGEVLMGRRGRLSPINTLGVLVKEAKASKLWKVIGYSGVLAGILIMSFYTVVAGWSVDYLLIAAQGGLQGQDADSIQAIFDNLLASPGKLLIWSSIFTLMTLLVVGFGVQAGLERAVKVLMPGLFLLLALLVGYALTLDTFIQGVHFLFDPDFSKLTADGVLVALGHAFFTLSLGMGAIMTYGSYMPEKASIGKTVLLVAFLDTLVALMAGMVIFPIVFEHALQPGSGPGLMFVTLPIAFGEMPWGVPLGTAFFMLVTFAAWSSSISLIEPGVAWLTEKGIARWPATLGIGLLCWLLSIGSVLSFNLWSGEQYQIFDTNFFDAVDWLTANIMLPLGGLLIAIFVGWVMKDSHVRKELQMKNEALYLVWRVLIRIVAPIAVVVIFASSLGWI